MIGDNDVQFLKYDINYLNVSALEKKIINFIVFDYGTLLRSKVMRSNC